MILSDESIRAEVHIEPFSERSLARGMSYGLSYCGYDVRSDVDSLIEACPGLRTAMLPTQQGIILAPGKGVRIPLLEYLEMPDEVVATVWGKSTWNRQGIMVASSVVEPGWRGNMDVMLFNGGDQEVTIAHGDPIAQLLFQRIDYMPTKTYDGKYQDEPRGPTGPKFER